MHISVKSFILSIDVDKTLNFLFHSVGENLQDVEKSFVDLHTYRNIDATVATTFYEYTGRNIQPFLIGFRIFKGIVSRD